jgi:prepilin peptidase CpaA
MFAAGHPLRPVMTELIFLTALLGVACATDVAKRRIPNIVVVAIFVLGLVEQWRLGGMTGLLLALAVGAGFFALFFLPWAFGKMGGGDLKLFTAVAVWITPAKLTSFVFYTALAAIPLAVLTYVLHQVKGRDLVLATHGVDTPTPPRATVPVAVAITCGALITLSPWSLPW